MESTQTRSIMVNDVSGADRRYLGLLLASRRLDELKSGPPRTTTASVNHGGRGGGASITVVSGDSATDVRVPFESSRSGL
jgi:hypothetical protein